MSSEHTDDEVIEIDTAQLSSLISQHKQSINTENGDNQSLPTNGDEDDEYDLYPVGLENDIRLLFSHAASGDVEGLEHLFEHSQIHPDTQDSSGHTPLLLASRYGHVDVMRLLIKEGANPLHSTQNGNSAFMLAAAAGQLASLRFLFEEVVPALLPSDLQVLLMNKNYDTVLMFALMAGQLRCAKYLVYLAIHTHTIGLENSHYVPSFKKITPYTLSGEKDPNEKSTKKGNATKKGNKQSQQQAHSYGPYGSYLDLDLLLHPLSLFFLNADGFSPLMCACECEQIEVVQFVMNVLNFVIEGKTVDQISDLINISDLFEPFEVDSYTQQFQEQSQDQTSQQSLLSFIPPLTPLCSGSQLDVSWLFHHIINIYLDESNGDEYDDEAVRAKYDTTRHPPKIADYPSSLTGHLSRPAKNNHTRKYVNRRDVNGNTALHIACRDLYSPQPSNSELSVGEIENLTHQNESISLLLLQNGADSTIPNHFAETPYDLLTKHFALSYPQHLTRPLPSSALPSPFNINTNNSSSHSLPSKMSNSGSHSIYGQYINWEIQEIPTILKIMHEPIIKKQMDAEKSSQQLLELKNKKKKSQSSQVDKIIDDNNNINDNDINNISVVTPPTASIQIATPTTTTTPNNDDQDQISQIKLEQIESHQIDTTPPVATEINEITNTSPPEQTIVINLDELLQNESPTLPQTLNMQHTVNKPTTKKEKDAKSKKDIKLSTNSPAINSNGSPVEQHIPSIPITPSTTTTNNINNENDNAGNWVTVGKRGSNKKEKLVEIAELLDSKSPPDKQPKAEKSEKRPLKKGIILPPTQPPPNHKDLTPQQLQQQAQELENQKPPKLPSKSSWNTPFTAAIQPQQPSLPLQQEPTITESSPLQLSVTNLQSQPHPSSPSHFRSPQKLNPNRPSLLNRNLSQQFRSDGTNSSGLTPASPSFSRNNPSQPPRKLTQIVHDEFPRANELALGAAHILGQGLRSLSNEQLECVEEILGELTQRTQDERRLRSDREKTELANSLAEAEMTVKLLSEKVQQYDQFFFMYYQQQFQQYPQHHQPPQPLHQSTTSSPHLQQQQQQHSHHQPPHQPPQQQQQ